MGIEVQQFGDGSRRLIDDQTGNTIKYADGTSRVCVSKIGSVARTDTTDKNLFTLPATAQVTKIRIWYGTASNAGTSATLSVGKTGTDTFFINAQDVKGVAAGTQVDATATNLYASVGTAAIQVVGIYAETGTASNTGGPFNIQLEYFVP